MSAAEVLLDRLPNAKAVGKDTWTATCPAHEDRKPSLSIGVVDHRILLHCWSGCSSLDIVTALGLRLSDLFTDRLTYTSRPAVRPPPFPLERARKVMHLALVIALAAGDLKHGKKLNHADEEALLGALGELDDLLADVLPVEPLKWQG